MKTHLLIFLGLAVAATGCRQGMYNQPRGKPFAENDFFDDHAMMRPLPPGVVEAGRPVSEAFETGSKGDVLVSEYPLPLTKELLRRGKERYDIYCIVCHGASGAGDGMIVQRGFPPPPSFHSDRLREAPIGHFVDVITHGYGVMYPYASRVEPADRWAIAAYIRALQDSQNATLEDVPDGERAKLEGEQ